MIGTPRTGFPSSSQSPQATTPRTASPAGRPHNPQIAMQTALAQLLMHICESRKGQGALREKGSEDREQSL
jgi:hypothetical protein